MISWSFIVRSLTVIIFFWIIFAPARFFAPQLQGDEASYLSYAMTIALDGDLDFSNEIVTDIVVGSDGVSRPKHPIGAGVMAVPIVATFSLIDRALSSEVLVNRYRFAGSWTAFGFLLGTFIWFAAGVVALHRGLGLLGMPMSRQLLLVAVSGSGIAFFTLHQYAMSHAHEFATIAFTILFTAEARQADGARRVCFLLLIVFSIVLAITVRPANVHVALLPLIVALIAPTHGSTLSPRPRWHGPMMLNIQRRGVQFAGVVTMSLAGLLALATVNRLFLGNWLPFPSISSRYGVGVHNAFVDLRERTILAQAVENFANVPAVILSPEFGLLYFMPVVPLGLFALMFVTWQRRQASGNSRSGLLAILVMIYVAIPGGVVLSWQSIASSYGYRYLFSLVPLGIVGYASWVASDASVAFRAVGGRILGALSVFGLFGQAFFWTSPRTSLTLSENTFGRIALTAPEMAQGVAAQVVDAGSWVVMLAMRFPGYVGAVALGETRTERLAESMGLGAVERLIDSDSATVVGVEQVVGWIAASSPGVPSAVLVFGLLAPVALAAWVGAEAARSTGPLVPRN